MNNVKRRFWLGSALMLSAACCFAGSSQAQVFKCIDADGHVVFTDTDCGSAKEKVDVVQSSGGLSSSIPATGLSADEKAALGQIEARDAEAAAQRASGAASTGGSSSAPAPAPSPSTATKSGY
jgi:hypothetical protein